MDVVTRQQTRLLARECNATVMRAAERAGYTPLQSRILAGRLPEEAAGDIRRAVTPRLANLDAPWTLPDIELAVTRIVRAIANQEVVVSASDFDCDGVTSQCVIVRAFIDTFGHPRSRMKPFIGLRLRDGYGVSDNLVDRILQQAPDATLVVTSDQGSSDHNRISRLRAHGIDTVVTDHHGIPDAGPPPEAVACVNPVRVDGAFPDRSIAGVGVAFLVMCAVRDRLIRLGMLGDGVPSLAHLLDLVSLGTVADAVSFACSRNNRAFVRHGLTLINQDRPRPCWLALRRLLGKDDAFTSTDLAFTAAPLVNAAGRLSDAMAGVRFLLAGTEEEAMRHLLLLHEANQERRQIEARLLETAMPQAERAVARGAKGVIVVLEDGHPGVHGITASRVLEAIGRPVGCFSPRPGDPDVLTGSFRSVPGIHIREALAEVNRIHPGLQMGFGGHAGAAGSHLRRENLARFIEAFEAVVARQSAGMELVPTILTDGELQGPPTLETVSEIAELGPFGREFEWPVFTMAARVVGMQAMGDGTHLRLVLRDRAGRHHQAVWFRAVKPGKAAPVEVGEDRVFGYEVQANSYRGETRVQLIVRAAGGELATQTARFPPPQHGSCGAA